MKYWKFIRDIETFNGSIWRQDDDGFYTCVDSFNKRLNNARVKWSLEAEWFEEVDLKQENFNNLYEKLI